MGLVARFMGSWFLGFALAAGLLVGVASTGASAEEVELTDLGKGLYVGRLQNGLKLILRENHRAPAIFFSVWYRVGSAEEQKGQTGMAHLLEHMLFKSTKKYPEGAIDRLYAEVGASWNATTGQDRTMYFALTHKEFVDVEMEIESERMRNALILPEELAREMTVVRNEFERGEDRPLGVLYTRLGAIAYLMHPYQNPVIGWRYDVENVTAEELKEFYLRYYFPDNAYVVAVGDFEAEEFAKQIDDYFGHLPVGKVEHPRRTPEDPQEGERRFVIRRPGTTDHLLIGWHIPDFGHPDSAALQVLVQLLNSKTGRLYEKLIDSGLAASYFVSGPGVSLKDGQLFEIYAQPAPGRSLEEVEKTIYETLDWYRKNLVSEEDLERAKRMFAIRSIKRRDSVFGDAFYLGSVELSVGIERLAEIEERHQAVTAEQVREVAGRYLTENNRTVGWYQAIKEEQPARGGMEGGIMGGPRMLRRDQALREDMPTPETIDLSLLSPSYPPAEPMAEEREAGEIAIPELARAKTTQFRLPNGIRVIVREDHTLPTFALSGLIDAGSIYDPPGKEGTAQLMARLMTEGAAGMDKRQIAARMEELGAGIGFSAGADFLSFSLSGLTDYASPSLELLAKLLLQPDFPQQEIELAKRQIVQGIKSDLASNNYVAWKKTREILLGKDHPYARDARGTVESVESITRDDLVEFHRRFIRPERTVIAVVGDITAEQARKLLERYFGSGWPQGKGKAPSFEELASKIPPPRHPQKEIYEHIEMPAKRQVALYLAVPGISQTDPRWYAAQVLNQVLSGGFTGRLMKKLRVEKGYTYGANARYNGLRLPGTYRVYVGINPVFYEEAMKLAKAILSDLAQNGVSEEEFELAKKAILGRLVAGQISNGAVAGTLASALALGRPYADHYYRGYAEKIKAVTLEEVNRLARELLSTPPVVVSAGELGAEEGEE